MTKQRDVKDEQRYYEWEGKRITPDEFVEIMLRPENKVARDNLSNYFRILNEWDLAEKEKAEKEKAP